MNITIYSHEAFVRLICCCIFFGFSFGIFACIIKAVLQIRLVRKCRDLRSLKTFLHGRNDTDSADSKVNDFASSVLIAIGLLFASFISNSGDFRLLSIPMLLLGFVCGVWLFQRIVILFVLSGFIIIKRILGIIAFPLVFVIKIIIRAIKGFVIIILKRYEALVIIKYTKKRYKDIDVVKQNGLLDPLYEVV